MNLGYKWNIDRAREELCLEANLRAPGASKNHIELHAWYSLGGKVAHHELIESGANYIRNIFGSEVVPMVDRTSNIIFIKGHSFKVPGIPEEGIPEGMDFYEWIASYDPEALHRQITGS